MLNEPKKYCKKCQKTKILSDFWKNKRTKDGYTAYCKECLILYNNQGWNNYKQKRPWMKSYHYAKQRCENSKNTSYLRYGGRRIKFLLTKDEIKELWFRDKAWLLKTPSLDRIDSDGNYVFENCQFISQSENSRRTQKFKIKRQDLINWINNWKNELNKDAIISLCALIKCKYDDILLKDN